MRRKEQEITDREALNAILAEAQTGHLGLVDAGKPYVVPVFFGFDGTAVYIHSAVAGRKIDVLKKNPDVFFTADAGTEIITSELACSFRAKYRSVMLTGTAEILSDREARTRGLDSIMRKYSEDPLGEADTFEYSPDSFERTAVIRIDIRTMTGKRSD